MSLMGTCLHPYFFQRGLVFGILLSSISTQVTPGVKKRFTHNLLILEITSSMIGSKENGGNLESPNTEIFVGKALSAEIQRVLHHDHASLSEERLWKNVDRLFLPPVQGEVLE